MRDLKEKFQQIEEEKKQLLSQLQKDFEAIDQTKKMSELTIEEFITVNFYVKHLSPIDNVGCSDLSQLLKNITHSLSCSTIPNVKKEEN